MPKKRPAEMNAFWSSQLEILGMSFPKMLTGGKFVDVTLVCDGRRIHCHRIVLAAYSPYFSDILEDNPAQHPIIILPHDVKFSAILALIEFIYKGVVSVSEDRFGELIRCAEMFQIRGFGRAISQLTKNFSNGRGSERPSSNLEESMDEVIDSSDMKFVVKEMTKNDETIEDPLGNLRPTVASSGTDGNDLLKPSRRKLRRSISSLNTKLSEQEGNETLEVCELSPYISSNESESDDETDKDYGRGKKRKILRKKPKNKDMKLPLELPLKDSTSIDSEAMWSALMSVKNGMAITRASKMYKVANGTLRNYMKRYGIQSAFPQPDALKKHQFMKNS